MAQAHQSPTITAQATVAPNSAPYLPQRHIASYPPQKHVVSNLVTHKRSSKAHNHL